MRRAEAQARAAAAVEKLLTRNEDPWLRYQRMQRELKLRKSLPKKIERLKTQLAQAEAQARDLGISTTINGRP